jgi:hypothetical protein
MAFMVGAAHAAIAQQAQKVQKNSRSRAAA